MRAGPFKDDPIFLDLINKQPVRFDMTFSAVEVVADKKEQSFLAFPYYAWVHRGPGEMAVWLARN